MIRTFRLAFQGNQVVAVHDDLLVGILKEALHPESIVIQRASNVEPSADSKTWTADLAPVGGPVLTGYTARHRALKAEIDYLNNQFIGKPNSFI